MKNKLFGILFIIFLGVMFAFVGCGYNHKSEQVKGKIIAKHYEPSQEYLTVVPIGKTVMPITQYTQEKFEIMIKYDDYNKTIDSKELYNSLNVGDSINMQLVKDFDYDGNLVRIHLEQMG